MHRPHEARARLAFAALAGLCLVAAALLVAGCGGARSGPRILEIEMQVSSGSFATLYWSADELRFLPEHSIRLPLSSDSEGLRSLRFPIPGQGVRWLRLDPTDSSGEVSIGRVRVLDANDGQTLGTLDPEAFYPANQIASITREGNLTRIVPVAGADDPFVFAAFACLDRGSVRDRLSQVTTLSLSVAAFAAAGLLLASVVVIGRGTFGRRSADGTAGDPARSSRRVAVVWMIVLFFVIFSGKLLLMQKNPFMVPFWDQWDGEARILYIPFNECRLTWPTMFSLHNEHRVFFTRLLALALLLGNGQWDPRLEQVANAVLHTIAALLLAAIVWRGNGHRRLDVVVLICAVAFAVPFSWENTLFAFQSAFYFLILFSVAALWLTTEYEAASGAWFLGWACAACALFTAAGGVLTPMAIALVSLLKMANERRWRDSLATLIVAAAVTLIGVALAAPPLAHHASLKAATVADFLSALGREFAWPWVAYPRLTVVMWLPIGLLTVSVLVRRARTSGLERFIFGLAGWVALNAGAIAYGRGAGGGVPAIRYMDFLSLGFVANGAALLIAVERAGAATLVRRVTVIASAAWLAFAIAGVDRLNTQNLEKLRDWRSFGAAHTVTVRRFVATGDVRELASKRPLTELPYPDAQTLIVTLRHPYIRQILPAAVREPLRLDSPVITNNAFVPDGSPRHEHDPLVRTWGSYAERGRNDEGWFESQPVGPCQVGSRLEFQVTGYLGMPHQYLATKEVTSGREAPVRPSGVPGEHWVSAVATCPEGPFVIKAIDGTRESWFAFREPREVGWASLVAEWWIARSRDLLLAALVLGIVAVRWT